jgi:hypothetical protein
MLPSYPLHNGPVVRDDVLIGVVDIVPSKAHVKSVNINKKVKLSL